MGPEISTVSTTRGSVRVAVWTADIGFAHNSDYQPPLFRLLTGEPAPRGVELTRRLHDLGSELLDDLYARKQLIWCPLLSVGAVLTASGAGVPLTPTAALELVVSFQNHLVVTGDRAPASVQKASRTHARLVRFLSNGLGVTDVGQVTTAHVQKFVDAPARAPGGEVKPPSDSTRHNRRWAATIFFGTLRQLGVVNTNPASEVIAPRGESDPVEALTTDAIRRCRQFAARNRFDTRGPAVWAVTEAGASTSETPDVVAADVLLDRRLIWLQGGARNIARWSFLSDWGVGVLRRRIDDLNLEPEDTRVRLVYEGTSGPLSAQSSVSEVVFDILRRAGVDVPGIRPRSVRAWLAREVFEQTGNLEQVRHRLGVESLDDARRLMGLPWGRSDVPPPHRRIK